MSTSLATTSIGAGAVPSWQLSSPMASTVTVTSVNTVRVHAAPQSTKVLTASLGGTISPNVNIASKRARLNSKDKDPKKLPTSSESTQVTFIKNDISLDSDLRNMMHAFGDICSPLDESIRLMESVLRQELQGFVFLCDSIAATSGSKSLGLQETIYAIKCEKPRLIRLLKYFGRNLYAEIMCAHLEPERLLAQKSNVLLLPKATKDQQQKLQRLNQMSQGVIIPTKLYLEEIRSILERLDEAGEFSRLLEFEYILEPSKTEKALRADKISQKINYPKYFTYSKARSVSFARKIGNLYDWITANTRSEYKMSSTFLEVLSFLAYEIVSQMVDLTFIVRREHVPSTNPMFRISDTRATNPETCMLAPAFQKRKDDQCNSVSEILVQASELEAKRLKKAATTNKEVHLPKNMLALTPNEIGEAYSRFQSCVLPAISYKVRAEKLRRLNHLY